LSANLNPFQGPVSIANFTGIGIIYVQLPSSRKLECCLPLNLIVYHLEKNLKPFPNSGYEMRAMFSLYVGIKLNCNCIRFTIHKTLNIEAILLSTMTFKKVLLKLSSLLFTCL